MNVSQVNVYPYQGRAVYEYLEKYFSAKYRTFYYFFYKSVQDINQECAHINEIHMLPYVWYVYTDIFNFVPI